MEQRPLYLDHPQLMQAAAVVGIMVLVEMVVAAMQAIMELPILAVVAVAQSVFQAVLAAPALSSLN
jgi:hypothetical protein